MLTHRSRRGTLLSEAQHRLWLSSGAGRVSLFREAVEQLFMDQTPDLQERATALGGDVDDAIIRLQAAPDLRPLHS